MSLYLSWTRSLARSDGRVSLASTARLAGQGVSNLHERDPEENVNAALERSTRNSRETCSGQCCEKK